jgi:hypothetical protein
MPSKIAEKVSRQELIQNDSPLGSQRRSSNPQIETAKLRRSRITVANADSGPASIRRGFDHERPL